MSTCHYCAQVNEEGSRECSRCGALLRTQSHTPSVDEQADQAECPSCGAINTTSAEYCTACGTPMAVITRVLELVSHNERGPLETWRVYGIETRMVARDAPLARLHELLDQVEGSGQAAFVGLRAGTGLGKSRLIAEFGRALDEAFSEALLVPVECREVTGGAFHMFARWFKTRFYIGEGDPPAIARRKLGEAIQALLGERGDEEVERITGLVGHLIGLAPSEPDPPDPAEAPEAAPVPEDEPKARDGSLLDQRGFEAVAEVLRADARRNPLVVVLEDLQYATDQSLRLVAYLRRELVEVPALFVLSWTPDELWGSSQLEAIALDERLELEPLTDDQVDALVRQTLHRVDQLPGVLVERIVESAHGNPLAVEEMLRLLISEGTIDTRQEAWRVDPNRIKKVKLPQTVEAAVRARIEALSDDERELLRMAACVGDTFWPALLACLWRLEQDMRGGLEPASWVDHHARARIEALVEGLERKDIIRRRDDSMLAETEELFFKHRLERKTIYQALASPRKQRYHRIIAQWLDQRAGDQRRGRLAEYIARHFDRARSLERAARKYIEAADWARMRYANRKAIELYTRGLSYLSDADIDLKIRAFHDLGSVHDLLGEYDQSLAYYRELLRYAWLLGDHNKGGVALNKIGRAYRSLGEFEEALGCLDQALEHFQRAEDLPGIASTLDDIGKIHWIRGRHDEALKHYRAALALRRELGLSRSIALSLNHIGSLHLQRGELREAMIYFREALDLRRQIDDREGVAESFNNLGILCMERGDWPQARTLLEEAREIVAEIGYRALEGIVLNNLGETVLQLGQVSRAREMLEEALEVAEATGEKRLIFDVLRNLGKVALESRQRVQAIAYIKEALELAAELDARALVGLGKQHLADVHAHYIFDPELGEQAAATAEDNYREAIELLGEVGHEAQLGRCLSSYGQLLVERGETVQGKKTLEMARAIFERLQMRKFWDATEHLIGAL